MNIPALGAFCYEDSLTIDRLKADLNGSISARKQLAAMCADSEKRLTTALNALNVIATSKYCQYEHSGSGQYGIGVADGHRWCAQVAHDALSTEHGRNDIVDSADTGNDTASTRQSRLDELGITEEDIAETMPPGPER